MKKGKIVLFTLLVGSVALTSCNKEASLANKLEDKWDIESLNSVVTKNEIAWYTGTTLDSTTIPKAGNTTTKDAVTGYVDFVDDDVVIINTTTITTTTTTNGSTTTETVSAPVEAKMSAEFFATGENEVTLVMGGTYTKYEVTTNEKDAQVWVNTDTNTNENYWDVANNRKTVTTTVTETTLSIKKAE